MSSVPKPRLPGGRLAFERAIRYSDLPAPARHLALTIATWADIESGLIPDRFQPAQTTLEEATGLSRGAVFKHSKLLEAQGWLIREGGGGRSKRVRHVLRIPPGAMTGRAVNVSPGDMFQEGNVSPGEQETCHVVNGNVSPGDTKSSFSTGEYQPPSPPPSEAPASGPAEASTGREGGGIVVDDNDRPAYEALLRITTAEPKLTIGEPEALTLLPLVVPWLERTTEKALREALTAGLPVQVGSPVGLLKTRLRAKLPPARVGTAASGPGGLPPWCKECADGGLNTAAVGNIKLRTLGDNGTGAKCPRCHPDAIKVAA